MRRARFARCVAALVAAGCASPSTPDEGAGACDDWVTAYADADADGYGDPARSARRCAFAPGWVADATDCDDARADLHPGEDAPTWFVDADGDGVGAPGAGLATCDPGAGYALTDTDCDDTAAAVHPGAAELCDGRDGDCDPATAEDGLATFTGEAGVVDLTAALTGSADAPAALTLAEPGALAICAGTWYAHLALAADVTITAPGGAAATTLDGGDTGPVLSVAGEGVVVEAADLTITGGRATEALPDGRLGGGGLRCTGDASVFLTDTSFVANAAEAGGAVASDTCWVHLRGGALTANTAGEGGAVWLGGGHFELEQADVTANTATLAGGAVAIDPAAGVEAFAAIADTVVSGNAAPEGGAVVLRGDTSLHVYGTGRDRAGLLANTSGSGGALRVEGRAAAELMKGDLGEPGTADDNVPADITTAAGGDVSAGDDLLGWCTADGCRWLEE